MSERTPAAGQQLVDDELSARDIIADLVRNGSEAVKTLYRRYEEPRADEEREYVNIMRFGARGLCVDFTRVSWLVLRGSARPDFLGGPVRRPCVIGSHAFPRVFVAAIIERTSVHVPGWAVTTASIAVRGCLISCKNIRSFSSSRSCITILPQRSSRSRA
jgi:hypothetical protein